ncbi:MAG: hypothetical protein Q9221_008435 [Calogaya cf. arnoldii]
MSLREYQDTAKCFYSDLSSLAAIIIILSLAIDPFAQQLAHLEVKPFVAGMEAVTNVQWMYSVQGTYDSYPTNNCSVYLPSLPHSLSVDIKVVDPEWQRTTIRATGKGALRSIDTPGLTIISYTQLTYLRPAPPRAIECTLRWCINRYSAQLESGVFTETYLDSWWSPADPQVLNFTDRGVFSHDRGVYFRITPQSRAGNVTLPDEYHNHILSNASNFPNAFSGSNMSGGFEPRYVHYLSHDGLSRLLASFLDVPGSSSSRPSYPDFEDPDIGGYVAELYDDFFHADPVHDIFSNLSAGLTQWLRQDEQARDNVSVDVQEKSGPKTYEIAGNRFAVGTAFEDRTIIRIRWGWLVFPIGLAAMTAVVTLNALLRSSRENIPVRGSSTVALMLRGPFSTAAETLPGSDSTDRFQRLARQTEVGFEKDVDDSWRIVQKRTMTERWNKTSISAFQQSLDLRGESRELWWRRKRIPFVNH